MMTNCPAPYVPTLSQLREYRDSGKVEVFKSQSRPVPIFDKETGELVAYGEQIDATQAAQGLHNLDDLNACLDSLIFGGDQIALVAKSADDDDLTGIFPLWLQ